MTACENELAHEKWCNDLAAKFLCVFVLDRFGDFVSDQVRLMKQPKVALADPRCRTGRCARARDSLTDHGFSNVTYASAIPFTRSSDPTTNDTARLCNRV